MTESGKTDSRVLDKFTGRWQFMRDTLERLVRENKNSKEGE